MGEPSRVSDFRSEISDAPELVKFFTKSACEMIRLVYVFAEASLYRLART